MVETPETIPARQDVLSALSEGTEGRKIDKARKGEKIGKALKGEKIDKALEGKRSRRRRPFRTTKTDVLLRQVRAYSQRNKTNNISIIINNNDDNNNNN